MLSLILSVRQLRQPSGLTQLSRFGSRDLGPPANQRARVFSMPMPNQIQSGDPINQTPFISKVPWNTGCSPPTARHLHEYARAAGTSDTFEIEMNCDSHSSYVMQKEGGGRSLSVSKVASNAGYADVKIVSSICEDPTQQKEWYNNDAMIWIHFVREMTVVKCNQKVW